MRLRAVDIRNPGLCLAQQKGKYNETVPVARRLLADWIRELQFAESCVRGAGQLNCGEGAEFGRDRAVEQFDSSAQRMHD
jgi:hypothetical protein